MGGTVGHAVSKVNRRDRLVDLGAESSYVASMNRLVLAVAVAFSVFLACPAFAGERAVVIPAPALDNPKAAAPTQTAVLAGGCFWGVQGVYQHVRGVQKVLSGYSGGTKATADYETISRGDTGHAESV